MSARIVGAVLPRFDKHTRPFLLKSPDDGKLGLMPSRLA